MEDSVLKKILSTTFGFIDAARQKVSTRCLHPTTANRRAPPTSAWEGVFRHNQYGWSWWTLSPELHHKTGYIISSSTLYWCEVLSSIMHMKVAGPPHQNQWRHAVVYVCSTQVQLWQILALLPSSHNLAWPRDFGHVLQRTVTTVPQMPVSTIDSGVICL